MSNLEEVFRQWAKRETWYTDGRVDELDFMSAVRDARLIVGVLTFEVFQETVRALIHQHHPAFNDDCLDIHICSLYEEVQEIV